MRGWLSSSVDDCSASCARSVTRCSDSRRVSSELSTSEASIGLPLWSISRISRAFDSASDFSARALFSCVLSSPICWLDSVVLLVPTNRLDFERKSSTRDSASRDLLAQIVDLAGQPLAGGLGLLLPRVLLQHQIAFGDRIGDARGQFRIARLEFDDDDARLVDRVGGEAVVIGFEHALFRRQRERIAADPEQRQQRFDRRQALQHRIEFRPLGELVLLDDLAREIARQQQLHLAGDRFGIERRCAPRCARRSAAGTRSRGRRPGCGLRICIGG